MNEKPADGNAGIGTPRDRLFSDQEITEKRYQKLRTYFEQNVLEETASGKKKFICKSKEDCKRECQKSPQASLFKGNLPYLGVHYDMTVCGQPQRLVVVGLDAPGEHHCNLDGRRKQFTNLNDNRTRNPHLQGTEQILRLMLRQSIGNDVPGRNPIVNGEQINIYETFTLLNMCICSCSHITTSRLTNTMMKNCHSHFLFTLKTLEPTIIVVQSINSAWRVLRRTMERAYDDFEILKEEPGIVRAQCQGWRILAFDHPSYRRKPWGYGTGEYFRSTVKPALEFVRDA